MSASGEKPIRLPLWVWCLVVPPAWLLARVPHALRAGIAFICGRLLYYGFPRRRRILFANLHLAFPDWSEARVRAVARKNCTGLVEIGIYGLCGPFLSTRWLKRHLHISPNVVQFLDHLRRSGRPAVIITPHTALLEVPLSISRFLDFPEAGVLFRPPNQSGLAAYTRWARTRAGVTMLSKKEGLSQARRFLSSGKVVAIPFDQNAGPPGTGIAFFDRLCSATDLPGSFARRFDAEIYVLFPIRRHGWEVEIELVRLEGENTPQAVTLASHQWLESMLRSEKHPTFCEDWMWNHNRWKTVWEVHQCLRLPFKKAYFPENLPRRCPIFIRIPDTLDDCAPLITLLQGLRQSRPDGAFTIMGSAALLAMHADRLRPFAESQLPIPERPGRAFWRQASRRYPEIWISLAEDDCFDREGVRLRAPFRIGIERRGQPRPQLSAAYTPPSDLDWEALTPSGRWLTFAASFGHHPDSSACPPQASG